MRLALGIEYVGSAYCGWERQRHCESVQSVLEAAISRVADEPVSTVCAGRTDAGVHAVGQVVHFDTDASRPARAWVLGVNAGLPPDVNVAWARPVGDGFHARFSARSRAYRYLILNRRARGALYADRAAWVHGALDVGRMQAAGRHLLGEHDFSAYRASGCQARSPVRTVHQLYVGRRGPLVWVDIRANAFLQHMVRNIVGSLLAVGAAKQDPDFAKRVLDSRDRRTGGATAPAHGLYLTRVDYPPAFDLGRPLDLSPPASLC